MPGPGNARAPVRRRIALAAMGLALAAVLASSTGRGSPVASTTAADPATSAAPATARGPVASTEPAAPSPAAPSPAAPPPPPAPPPAVDPATRLAVLTTVADVAAQAGGTVQVAVRDAAGVEMLASPGAGTPVLTASLVKLLVVQQLFAREAVGLITLSPADLDLMQRAITSSDDSAMSALWSRFGGAELVTAAAAEFGLSGSSPPQVAGQWGEAVTTAADIALFLSTLGDHLAPEDLATLTGWMRSTTGIATDGFDQRFGLLSPTMSATTLSPVAAKQGWMCCIDRRRQLHSIGTLVDGRTVALLGEFPLSTDWIRARAVLDQVAAVVTAAP
jgi:hypothetical protein